MKFNLKKLMVCGLSLLTITGIGASNVSAKRVHHHYHHRITRVMKRSNHKIRLASINAKNPKYLTFKQLIKAMDHDGTPYSDDKYHTIIIKTIRHNLKNYSSSQIDTILTNKVTNDMNGYGFDPNLAHQLHNQLYTKTDYVKLESNQLTPFNTAVRSNLIKDINNTRISNGLNPLKVTNVPQGIANYRDAYVQYAYNHLNEYKNYPHNTSNPTDNWVHGYDLHCNVGNFINHYGFNNHTVGSNVGTWRANNNGKNPDGTSFKSDNTTPQGVANNINDEAINHDNVQGNHNGHRYNELNPQWKYLGVGVSYDPKTNIGTFNEQFTN